MSISRYVTLGLTTLFFALPAQAIELEVPVDCAVGKDCFIQNYVDINPTKKWADYTCNTLSYDEHDGVDFRVKTLQDMQAGVTVKAAAAGKVKAVRDGMADISIKKIDPKTIEGKDCGNGVILTHEGGYETQYCHLKKGSIIVKPGQDVKVGQPLAKIGLSGRTEFPHVHFGVRKDGVSIDPFTGLPVVKATAEKPAETDFTCAPITDGKSLWSANAQKAVAYVPTALLSFGFRQEAPDVEKVREGGYAQKEGSVKEEVLALWADFMGIQAQDRLIMKIFDPAGNMLVAQQKDFPDPKAVQFFYIGKRFPVKMLPGTYKGTMVLERKNTGSTEILFNTEATIDVK